MRPPLHLIVAWLASALTFAAAFVAWMFITVKIEGSPLPKNILGITLLGLGAGLVVQLIYGSLVYSVLTRAGAFTLWAVAAAYLVPVVLFSWRASDTYQDLIGTIPWLIFAILVGTVFWLFGSGRVFGGRVL
jgi:hypothetical protein